MALDWHNIKVSLFIKNFFFADSLGVKVRHMAKIIFLKTLKETFEHFHGAAEQNLKYRNVITSR